MVTKDIKGNWSAHFAVAPCISLLIWTIVKQSKSYKQIFPSVIIPFYYYFCRFLFFSLLCLLEKDWQTRVTNNILATSQRCDLWVPAIILLAYTTPSQFFFHVYFFLLIFSLILTRENVTILSNWVFTKNKNYNLSNHYN